MRNVREVGKSFFDDEFAQIGQLALKAVICSVLASGRKGDQLIRDYRVRVRTDR
jgi:hypothetical protein